MTTETTRLMRPATDVAGRHRISLPSPPVPLTKKQIRRKKAIRRLKVIAKTSVSGLRAATIPALDQLKDHCITIAAGCTAIAAACQWNAKAGFITATIVLLAIEMKVSKQLCRLPWCALSSTSL